MRCDVRYLIYPGLAIGCVLVLLSCGGCGKSGDKYDRLAISGTVTLDGQPLTNGYLIFEPKNSEPTQSGGMISQGKFEVPRKSGPVAGKYSVAIFSGADPAPAKAAPGTPEAELVAKKSTGERIPRKYNVDTTLTAEVGTDKENVFKFDLQTK